MENGREPLHLSDEEFEEVTDFVLNIPSDLLKKMKNNPSSFSFGNNGNPSQFSFSSSLNRVCNTENKINPVSNRR